MELIHEKFDEISVGVEWTQAISFDKADDIGLNFEKLVTHIEEVGPAVIVVSKANGPHCSSNVNLLNTAAIGGTPIPTEGSGKYWGVRPEPSLYYTRNRDGEKNDD